MASRVFGLKSRAVCMSSRDVCKESRTVRAVGCASRMSGRFFCTESRNTRFPRRALAWQTAALALALVALLPLSGRAQLYKVDALFADSVQAYAASEGDNGLTVGVPAMKVAGGDTLLVEGKIEGKRQYGVFTRDGAKYAVQADNLVFCSSNAEDTADLFPLSTASRRHTPLAHFFAHTAPVAAMGGLLLLALALTLAGWLVRPLRRAALSAVPLCMLLAAGLAFLSWHALGDEALWWCDKDICGRAASYLRVFLLSIAVTYVLGSFRLYRAALFAGRGSRASLRGMALSIGACVPVLLLFLAVGWLAGLRGETLEYSAVAVFFASLLAGTVFSTLHNVRRFGTGTGLALTVFAGVYVVSCAAAIGMVALAFVTAPLQSVLFALVAGLEVTAWRATCRALGKKADAGKPSSADSVNEEGADGVEKGESGENEAEAVSASAADNAEKSENVG